MDPTTATVPWRQGGKNVNLGCNPTFPIIEALALAEGAYPKAF